MKQPFFNLEVIQTNTKTWKFQVSDKTGAPVPLAGYLVFFTVKANLTDTDDNALIAKSFTIVDDVDASNGIFFVSLTESDTNIAIGEYYFDFKLQQDQSGGAVLTRRTLGTGKFIVNTTITQRIS